MVRERRQRSPWIVKYWTQFAWGLGMLLTLGGSVLGYLQHVKEDTRAAQEHADLDAQRDARRDERIRQLQAAFISEYPKYLKQFDWVGDK